MAVSWSLVVAAAEEDALEVPVLRRAESDALPLALDQDPGRDALHPAGRQPGHDLLPQDRADLVPVEAVEDPAGLLRVDQPFVDLARVLHRCLDRLRGDLVEDHPADRHPWLERLAQVPGDRLALAVLVRGQVKLAGVLEQRLELADLSLLVRRDDVERLEAVVDVDAEPGPGLTLDAGRHVGSIARQVPDVTDARFDQPARPEVAGDGLGLGRGLHDDQPGAVTVAVRGAALACRRARPGRRPGGRLVGRVLRCRRSCGGHGGHLADSPGGTSRRWVCQSECGG